MVNLQTNRYSVSALPEHHITCAVIPVVPPGRFCKRLNHSPCGGDVGLGALGTGASFGAILLGFGELGPQCYRLTQLAVFYHCQFPLCFGEGGAGFVSPILCFGEGGAEAVDFIGRGDKDCLICNFPKSSFAHRSASGWGDGRADGFLIQIAHRPQPGHLICLCVFDMRATHGAHCM